MMSREQILVELRHVIPELEQKYHMDSLSVFGSVARGDHDDESDLDLLVSFTRPVSLITLELIELFLSEKLGMNVEIVTEPALKPRFKDAILSEAINVSS